MAPRGILRVWCHTFPWKNSFPRDEMWHFHETRRGVSMRRGIYTRHGTYFHEAWYFHESWNFQQDWSWHLQANIQGKSTRVLMVTQVVIQSSTLYNASIRTRDKDISLWPTMGSIIAARNLFSKNSKLRACKLLTHSA